MNIEKIMSDLIEDDKIPVKAICTAANISEEQFAAYTKGEPENLSSRDISYLNELSMILGVGINSCDADERLKGIVESLIEVYGFTVNQLSNLLNINYNSIQDLLDGKKVDINEKYSMAVSVSYLFYALKRAGQVKNDF